MAVPTTAGRRWPPASFRAGPHPGYAGPGRCALARHEVPRRWAVLPAAQPHGQKCSSANCARRWRARAAAARQNLAGWLGAGRGPGLIHAYISTKRGCHGRHVASDAQVGAGLRTRRRALRRSPPPCGCVASALPEPGKSVSQLRDRHHPAQPVAAPEPALPLGRVAKHKGRTQVFYRVQSEKAVMLCRVCADRDRDGRTGLRRPSGCRRAWRDRRRSHRFTTRTATRRGLWPRSLARGGGTMPPQSGPSLSPAGQPCRGRLS